MKNLIKILRVVTVVTVEYFNKNKEKNYEINKTIFSFNYF